jgi:anthranilate/para-aminobenzoate synthase component I
LLHDGKAWVYAGAGIMADSDPDAEYTETELKMQALLGALNGDGR